MLATYPFSGNMNIDDPDLVVPQGHHRMARNGFFRGNQGRMRFESILGTNLVSNSFLPGTGNNVTIGCHYDAVNQRVFFFNFNSNGEHGIYIYNTLTGIFQRLIQSGVNTQGDVLGFTATGRINSICIIYGDQNSGDLLCYIDSLRRPTKLNIQRYLAGTYNPILREYIDLIKAPPRMPPRVTYENDPNNVINNMRNALFKFRYRFVYDDNDKSVYSTTSIVPLPDLALVQSDSSPTQNCRISVYLSTGEADVKKIELWMLQSTDGGDSTWMLVNSFDKSILGLPDNDVFRSLFYNDGIYTPADQKEIDLLFDFVPIGANAMVLLNGNVIMMGGITEGYDSVPINATITTNNNFAAPYTTVNGMLFFASQGGVDSNGTGNNVTIYLTGAGTNDGSGNPTTIPFLGSSSSFVVDCATTSGSSLKFTFTAVSQSSITVILNGLKAAAMANGFTFVSQTQNALTLNFAAGFVLYYAQNYNTAGNMGVPETSFAYGHKDAYQYAIEYFDAKGRTNGALLPVKSSIQTIEDLTGNSIPDNVISIFSRPPQFAAYYHLVRSLNLTYNKRTFWVSSSTFAAVDQGTGIKFAYINIGNMADYNLNIQASGIPSPNGVPAVVSYDFAAGDRIQFLQNIPFGGGTPISLSVNNDYEILAVVDNPLFLGITQNGRFIKIQYPTADVNGNFDFGGSNFQNYKILLYNYIKHSSTASQIVFNEFGRTWAIGNPGTSNAYHIASEQTQAADLSQPAIISTVEGDMFWRQRVVPAGNSYFFPTQSYIQAHAFERFITVITPDIITPEYRLIGNDGTGGAQPVGPTAAVHPFYADNDPLAFNTSASARSFRFRGTIQVTPNNSSEHNGVFGALLKVITSAGAVTTFTVLQDQAGLENPTTYSFPYDISVQLNPNDKVWLLTHAVNQMVVANGQQRIDALDNVTIPIIETSYSDKFNIVTNSNGRVTVFDPNAGQFYFDTLVRWGQADQLGTNLNNSNRFFPQDFDEFDKSFGDIMRLITREREVDVFQKRKCGHVAVFGRFVQNNQGQQELLTTDQIITPNNIQYYNGDFGVGNQPDAISVSGYQRYFCDPVKGYVCRLSLDGIQPISEIFKVQTWAGVNLPNYLNQYNYQFGGNAVILGAYNFLKDRDSETLFCLQGGTSGLGTIPSQTITFTERTSAFSYFIDMAPDSILCAENLLILFQNGNLFTNNNANAPANFFGNQTTPSITAIYKEPTLEKKTFLSVTQVSNVPWVCPAISTNTFSFGTTFQQSNLVEEDFTLLGTDWVAPFWFDQNSQDGLIDGDPLQANLISIQFDAADPTTFSYLSEVSIRFIDSPLTVK